IGSRVAVAAGWSASVAAHFALRRAERKRPAPLVSDRREPQAPVPAGAKPWEQAAPARRSTLPMLPIPAMPPVLRSPGERMRGDFAGCEACAGPPPLAA